MATLDPYVMTLWVDEDVQPTGTPDIDAGNLLKIEQGLFDSTEAIRDLQDDFAGLTHAQIAGLDADDHLHYALANGARLRAWRNTVAPTSPLEGQLWLDKNATPSVLKSWTGSAWESVAASVGGAGGIDHGDLTGLGDDDHLIYALANGTRLRIVRSGTAPSSPSAGQLWGDTGTTPLTLKEYNGSAFVAVQAEPVGPIAKAKLAALNIDRTDMATDRVILVVCTSSTRPTTPVEGQLIYETNTDKIFVNVGTTGSPVWRQVQTVQEIAFTAPGNLAAGKIPPRWRVPFNITIVYIRWTVDVPSQGTAAIATLYRALSGSPQTMTELYTTTANRPTIPALGYNPTTTELLPDTVDISAGDHLQGYVVQAGTTPAQYGTLQVGYVVRP